jgi:hypothetical protein
LSFTSTFPTNIAKLATTLVVKTIAVSDSATGADAVSSMVIGVLDLGAGAEAPVVGVKAGDLGAGAEAISSRLVSLEDVATGLDRLLQTFVLELLFKSFAECAESLRYVSMDMPVESTDINTITHCLKLAKDTLDKYRYKLRMPAGDIDPLIDELDAILSRIRYVRAGDVIEPDDHNLKVDAIKVIRDILSKMESYYILQPNMLASVSPFAGIGISFGFATTPDAPVPPSLPYAGSGLLTVDVAYDYGYASPCTSLVVEAPVYKPGYYISDGVG